MSSSNSSSSRISSTSSDNVRPETSSNTTTTYWYSTNGMDRKRLADRHVTALDEAFDQQARVEIFDDEAFRNKSAIASPHLGTMTSGDIHYGLYREPSLWEQNEANLDNINLVLGSSSSSNGNGDGNDRQINDQSVVPTIPFGQENLKGRLDHHWRLPSNSRNSNSTSTTTSSTTADIRRRQHPRGSLDVLCCIVC
jgi:hypothetical protein